MRDVRKISGGSVQTQRTAAARKPAKRRNRRNMALYYFIMLVFVAIAGALLSVTVFFNITTIEVIGETEYTYEQIIGSGKVKVGDNLFRLNQEKTQTAILNELIKIETVEVQRELPATLKIYVTAAEPYAGVKSENGYYLISRAGRVIEKDLDNPPVNVITFYGYEPVECGLGDTIKSAQTLKQGLIFDITDAINSAGLVGVKSADITDRLNMVLNFEDRVTVEIGSPSELVYKVTFARELLFNEIETNEIGAINFHSGGASFLPNHDATITTGQSNSEADETTSTEAESEEEN